MDRELFQEDEFEYLNNSGNRGKQQVVVEEPKERAPIFRGRAKLVVETNPTGKGTGDVAQEVMEARSEAFLECLKDGMSKSEAAEAIGVPLKELTRDPIVMEMAKDLVRRYKFSAQERRELARAKLNQILLEGEDRFALQAAKQIGEDHEVGIAARGVSVGTMNVGVFGKEASEVLASVPKIDGWTEVIEGEVAEEDG